MKIEYKIILISIFLGLLFWIIDAILDFLLFYKGTFLELLITNVPAHEIYIRTVAIVCFFVFGVLISKIFAKRKKMEEELKNALSEWEVTFNAAKDSTMLIDDKFKIFKANLVTERFLGKHLNEILGGTCYELVHGTDAPPDTCPLKTAKNTKKHEEIELYVPEKNVWLSATVDPILDDKGNLTRAVHIIKDITERKQAEEKIKEQNIQLKKLNKIKSDFLNVTKQIQDYSAYRC